MVLKQFHFILVLLIKTQAENIVTKVKEDILSTKVNCYLMAPDRTEEQIVLLGRCAPHLESGQLEIDEHSSCELEQTS